MSRASFRSNCDAALTRIVNRLHTVAEEFGPDDMPKDKGKTLRNRLCNFAYSFFQIIDFYCFEQPEDSWSQANGELVREAQPGVLFSLAGSTHFYIECCNFARAKSSRSVATQVLLPDNSIQTPLDWLTNMYAVAPEVPIAWYKLSTTLQTFEEFVKEANCMLEQSASFELGRPPEISDDSWSGLASAVDLATWSVDEGKWAAHCQQIFAT